MVEFRPSFVALTKDIMTHMHYDLHVSLGCIVQCDCVFEQLYVSIDTEARICLIYYLI